MQNDTETEGTILSDSLTQSLQSETIGKLAEALAKAQGQMQGAVKDAANPFFKSKYADLASCWDACRKPLSDNGLSVIQTTSVTDDGKVMVVTTLMHSSGEWKAGVLPVRAKDDSPQAMGSGITYTRRYALAGIVGLVQVDDDAEAAMGRISAKDRGAQTRAVNDYAKRIVEALNLGMESAAADVMREAKEEGEEVAVAVWGSLGTPLQNRMRDIADRTQPKKGAV